MTGAFGTAVRLRSARDLRRLQRQAGFTQPQLLFASLLYGLWYSERPRPREDRTVRLCPGLLLRGLLLCGCQAVLAGGAAAQEPAVALARVDVPGLLDCARESGVTMLSAHRAGAGPGLPENSLAAMDASIAAGALVLEVDVAQTADDALVLMHDRTVDRTTTGTGAVAELRLAELRAMRLRDPDGRVHPAPPPTLGEALAHVRGRAVLQLDPKGVGPRELVDALRRERALGQVLVIAYTIETAVLLQDLAPGILVSVGIDTLEDLAALEAGGMDLAQVVAWLGVGSGNPALDEALAARAVETSYADFRSEQEPGHDYVAHASAGAELLSVDEVAAASEALEVPAGLRRLMRTCSVFRNADGGETPGAERTSSDR